MKKQKDTKQPDTPDNEAGGDCVRRIVSSSDVPLCPTCGERAFLNDPYDNDQDYWYWYHNEGSCEWFGKYMFPTLNAAYDAAKEGAENV